MANLEKNLEKEALGYMYPLKQKVISNAQRIVKQLEQKSEESMTKKGQNHHTTLKRLRAVPLIFKAKIQIYDLASAEADGPDKFYGGIFKLKDFIKINCLNCQKATLFAFWVGDYPISCDTHENYLSSENYKNQDFSNIQEKLKPYKPSCYIDDGKTVNDYKQEFPG
jgi:hypothetical protein